MLYLVMSVLSVVVKCCNVPMFTHTSEYFHGSVRHPYIYSVYNLSCREQDHMIRTNIGGNSQTALPA